jgi:hypothetical protein
MQPKERYRRWEHKKAKKAAERSAWEAKRKAASNANLGE